jgi:primary-amine oxidase
MLMYDNRPVEIHQLHIKPSDFFSANPSIDVPSNKKVASTHVEQKDSCCQDKPLKEKL